MNTSMRRLARAHAEGDPQLVGVMMRKAMTAPAPMVGHMKLRFRLSKEVLRHASKGPTAVRIRSSSATGIATRL